MDGELDLARSELAVALDMHQEMQPTLAPPSCVSCQIMLAVPASIACADAGRLDDAAAFIVQAEISRMMRQGSA